MIASAATSASPGTGGSLRILVIGAGIAGLTAASALGQKGFQVDVIERRPQVSDDGGIGLSLVSNALRALDTIGVAEGCLDIGVSADSIAMCDPDGNPLFDNPLPRIGGDKWPGATGIARAGFHALLLGAARDRAAIRCGRTVERWEEDDAGITAWFNGGDHAAYDLIVAADGIYSTMRSKLFPDCVPEHTGQAVWRAAVHRPPGVSRTHLFLGGPQGLVGLCPVSVEQAYLYIVQSSRTDVRRDPGTLHRRMAEQLAGYGGIVADLLAELTEPSAVSYRPIERMLAPKPWGRGRIVLIGDAAHANPPVLAQGAAMGIEDAVVLADELAASPRSVGHALDRFVGRRYDRAAFVVDTSCQLARWEVEHARDVDIPGVMRMSAQRLAEAI